MGICKKFVWFLAGLKAVMFVALLFSCDSDPIEIGSVDDNGSSSKIYRGTGNSSTIVDSTYVEEEIEEVITHIYTIGVSYPEGVDWSRDMGSDYPDSEIFLYCDSLEVQAVLVGEYLSTDASSHWVIGDDVYADFSTDSQTIITRNGVELFRYDSREVIVGLALDGDTVFTLGESRSGLGWSYRSNGSIIVSRSSGALIGHLHSDEESLYFAFSEASSSYFCLVKDGVTSGLDLELSALYDILVRDGVVYYVGKSKEGTYVYGSSSNRKELTYSGSMLEDLQLHSSATTIFITGSLKTTSGIITQIWRNGTAYRSYSGSLLGFAVSNLNCCGVTDNSGSLEIHYNKTTYTLGSSYSLIYDRCITFHQNQLLIALVRRSADSADSADSSASADSASSSSVTSAVTPSVSSTQLSTNGTNTPVIWCDGVITEYSFNGFFSGLIGDGVTEYVVTSDPETWLFLPLPDNAYGSVRSALPARRLTRSQ